ncbi:hypothetical protein, partial [Hafnia paralvei]|uniref:hypothetical protein n=1 Tax=Hafnia paralvei TaxID=546367 RepID=UPI0029D8C62F
IFSVLPIKTKVQSLPTTVSAATVSAATVSAGLHSVPPSPSKRPLVLVGSSISSLLRQSDFSESLLNSAPAAGLLFSVLAKKKN